MKRLTFSVLLLLNWSIINAQINLTIEGKSFTNSEETWLGVDVPREVPTRFFYKNNSITSINRFGYQLLAGDEGPHDNNNNLDGSVITGNRFSWSGTDMVAIPHGLFTGHNINVVVKYNYLNNVPMGIIRKSSTNMVNTGGGVAYNIVKGGAVGIVVKGISNVRIYNNTIYGSRTPSQTWRPLIHIYTNTDFGGYSVAHGTKIYNNVFYTRYRTHAITIQDAESLTGLECDYNIYWSEAGTPVFNVGGSERTFAQWQAMGFDKHSVVVNPGFTNLVDFVPSKRLDFGKDLGDEWRDGLSVNAVWGTLDPETSFQNGTWQAGAIVHSGSSGVESMDPVYTSAFFDKQDPDVLEVNFNSVNPEIMPSASAFEVIVNSSPVQVIKADISENTVFLTLSDPISVDDNVTVSYTAPGQNPLQNYSGGLVESFPPRKVINLESSEIISTINIFPNPARDNITISNLPPILESYFIRIYDLSGKLQAEIRLDPNYDINIPVDLAPGMYIVQVIRGRETNYIKRLVIIE